MHSKGLDIDTVGVAFAGLRDESGTDSQHSRGKLSDKVQSEGNSGRCMVNVGRHTTPRDFDRLNSAMRGRPAHMSGDGPCAE